MMYEDMRIQYFCSGIYRTMQGANQDLAHLAQACFSTSKYISVIMSESLQRVYLMRVAALARHYYQSSRTVEPL